ncbi:LAMI_0A07910g1_1 [Lachancea mirantina]|uniref:Cargo-transport protein YPP1 n=1 Tax=Lachancea mirantina TaxID=1230905 RepID=A0A1G4IR05_9SACH|nr:LAMI_0A07910g1_1 [Lachancea mirantina]
MTSAHESVERALEKRLVGSGTFFSEDEQLNDLLSLQYRLHYHTLGSASNLDQKVAEILLKDCKRVERSLSGLKEKIWRNIAGILYFYLSNIDKATEQLKLARQITYDHKAFDAFYTFLNVENLYYRILLSESPKELLLRDISKVAEHIPRDSNAIAFHYLDSIASRVPVHWGDAAGKLHSTPLACYLAICTDYRNHDAELLKVGGALLKEAKFPKADESNHELLEEFHVALRFYLERVEGDISLEWNNFIISSMAKTFQSMNVAKTAMVYFSRVGKHEESILNFVNFLNYNDNYRHLNEGKYFDIISVLHSYHYVIEYCSGHEIQEVYSVAKTIQEMELLLKYFYDQYSFPLLDKDNCLDWLSNSIKLKLSSRVAAILGNSWAVIYRHYKDDLVKLINDDLCFYLSNSLVANPGCAQTKFEYAYTLATKREINFAKKYIKMAILEVEPNDYRAWHLLALCESVEEQKDVAFKIVCSVLQGMNEALTNGTLTSTEDRWQFIFMKLTQLSLLEDMFGVRDALELLPELFEVYKALFQTGEKHNYNLGTAYNQSIEYLHQFVWLFASKLYDAAGNLKEAKEALHESIAVTRTFKNLNNNLANGYLLLKTNHKKALTEFETVFYYDQLNTDAIVGFARLLNPEEPASSNHVLKASEREEKKENAFYGDGDKSAAYGRLKLMLEEAIEKSIDAHFSPEIWWHLSKIYEKFGDTERLEIALWNCIKYEELQPIRHFKNCHVFRSSSKT